MTYEEAVRIADKLCATYNPNELTYEQVARFCELALRSAWRDKEPETLKAVA